jgi:thiamine-monophosphate kinase
MKISEWGEENIIESIKDLFALPLPIKGIGDDCAVIPLGDNKSLLVTKDLLVESVHFFPSISPRDLGYKSVMVNISDIAAMGGTAKYLFLGMGLPSSLEKEWVDKFFEGFREACSLENVVLLGGDTVGSPNEIFLSITALGEAPNDRVKYRSSAQEGDLICVTGLLGESAVGLQCLIHPVPESQDVSHVLKKHLRPSAHSQQGLFLSHYPGVHAMADISDGLHRDLANILKSSNMGAVINMEQIPLSLEAKKICRAQGWDYESLALTGGEDYSLLLTISPEEHKNIHENFHKTFACPLYKIGYITKNAGAIYLKNGHPYRVENPAFNHFKEVK